MSNVLTQHNEKIFFDLQGKRFPLDDKQWTIAYSWFTCRDLEYLKQLKLGPQTRDINTGIEIKIEDWEPVLVGVVENPLVQGGIVRLAFPENVAIFAVKYLKLTELLANEIFDTHSNSSNIGITFASSSQITGHIESGLLSSASYTSNPKIMRDLSNNGSASDEYRAMASLLVNGP